MRQTVYLDWSDIQRSFDGAKLDCADPNLREMASIFERMTKSHDLVLSFHHLGDLCGAVDSGLSRHKALSFAREKAIWLDHFPKLWIKADFEHERAEIRSALVKELVGQRIPPFLISESFLSMFHCPWNVETFANALKNPTIEAFVSEMLGSDDGAQQFVDFRRAAVDQYARLIVDRKLVQLRSDEGLLIQQTAIKFRAFLNENLNQAIQDIRIDGNRGPWNVFRQLEDEADYKERFLDKIISDVSLCPLAHLGQQVLGHTAWDSVGMRVTSSNFIHKHRSMYDDIGHLKGAVYCDVFTCDNLISDAIGNFRQRIGKRRQLSWGELGPKEFLTQLKIQLGF